MNPAAQAKGEVNRGNAAGLSGSKNTRHSRSLIDPMTSEAHALVYAALSWIAEDLDALAALESPAPARPADDEEIVEGLAAAKPKAWDYKPGQGDGKRHIGPIAEEMHERFGDTVAPGGKAIDVTSSLGLHHAAINNLNRRVKKLEGKQRR